MDRRTFIGSLALGALAAPRVVLAQPARRVARIGILSLGATSDLVGPRPRSPSINAFLRGLHELGYVYGEHFVIEPRGIEGKPERFPSAAAELVRLQLDVIVAAGAAVPALKQATSTIPIVMAAAGDPVGSGYVQSLGHPGGNVTGLSLQSVETAGKRLEMLKELVPAATPVAVVWDRTTRDYWQAAEVAARGAGVEATVARDSRRWRDRGGLPCGDCRPGRRSPRVLGCDSLPPRSTSRGTGRRESTPDHV